MSDSAKLEQQYIIEASVCKYLDAMQVTEKNLSDCISMCSQEARKLVDDYTTKRPQAYGAESFDQNSDDYEDDVKGRMFLGPYRYIEALRNRPLDHIINDHVAYVLYVRSTNENIRNKILQNNNIYHLLLYLHHNQTITNLEVDLWTLNDLQNEVVTNTCREVVNEMKKHTLTYKEYVISPISDFYRHAIENFDKYRTEDKIKRYVPQLDTIDIGEYEDTNPYFRMHVIWLLMNLGLYQKTQGYQNMIDQIVSRYDINGDVSNLPKNTTKDYVTLGTSTYRTTPNDSPMTDAFVPLRLSEEHQKIFFKKIKVYEEQKNK